MSDTIVTTTNDVKFIEGTTLMTQLNWQDYFGKTIPNGIYSGFDWEVTDPTDSNSTVTLTDGVAFANGMLVKVTTPSGVTNIPGFPLDNTDKGRLVKLRIYLNESRAEIVSTLGGFWALGSDNVGARNKRLFVRDESRGCTRNDQIYELPLFFQYYDGYKPGFDLRRVPEFLKKRKYYNHRESDILIQDNNVYYVSCDNLSEQCPYLIDSNGRRMLRVHFDGINQPKNAKLIIDLVQEPTNREAVVNNHVDAIPDQFEMAVYFDQDYYDRGWESNNSTSGDGGVLSSIGYMSYETGRPQPLKTDSTTLVNSSFDILTTNPVEKDYLKYWNGSSYSTNLWYCRSRIIYTINGINTGTEYSNDDVVIIEKTGNKLFTEQQA